VLAAQRYAQQGYRIVVDVDLSKFFDRVNHDILIDRLSQRVNDAGVIRLVRAYLNAGIMDGGVVIERVEGTPQGGPLSPLLANVLLDEVDRELERRGHRFARYADDCNVYVRSQKAGERVMSLLKRCYDKLHLKINQSKSAVTSVFGRKFLGYALWQARNGEVRRGVSEKALEAFKQRIRRVTRRSGGRGMAEVVEKLRSYLLGWKGYFGLAQTPRLWRSLDEWIRRRLRALQLKQWRRGKTIYRELLRLGANPGVAQSVAALSRRWWHNSLSAVHHVLTVAYFDRLGVPRLS
jgi:RNA-directed DNA polymerase